jgi:hypothetical protein
MVQGCAYASSVDVPLEVIVAAGKRQVVEVGGRSPSHRAGDYWAEVNQCAI